MFFNRVGVTLIGNVVNAVGKVAFLAVASRELDPGIFAVFAFQIAIVEVASIVLDFGNCTASITSARKFKNRETYRSALYFGKSILTVAPAAVLGVLYKPDIAVYTFAVLIFEFGNALLQQTYSFTIIAFRYAGITALRLIALFFLVHSQISGEYWLLIFYSPILLIACADTLVRLYGVLRSAVPVTIGLSQALRAFWFLVKYGRPNYLIQLLAIVLRRGDLFYIAFIMSEESAGLLGALLSICNFIPMIGAAIFRVLLPTVMDDGVVGDFISSKRRKILWGAILASLATVPFLLLAYHFVIAEEARVGLDVAAVAIFAISINIAFGPISTLLYRQEKVDSIARIHFEQFLAQAFVSVLLIYQFGLLGASISLLVVRLYGLNRVNAEIRRLPHG